MDIKTENLSHIYMPGSPISHVALDNINLEIKTGSFVGLIGHTGSGKSTLIQHFNGLLKPTSGKVLLGGKDINESRETLKQLRFKVGLVFQYPEYQLFDETVEADIAYGPKNMELTEAEIKERVFEAINYVSLDEALLKKSPFELSGGQRRRAAIAGILALRPEVLILDEPTAGLDPKGRDDILSNISRLQKERGITVILVSHSMEDVAKVCESVIVMNKGTVAMQGSVRDVFRESETLKKLQLNVPQITQLVLKLRREGYNLPDDIYTTDKAFEEFLKLIKKSPDQKGSVG